MPDSTAAAGPGAGGIRSAERGDEAGRRRLPGAFNERSERERPGPVRLGYHGSPLFTARVASAGGWAPEDVAASQYDIADPFRTLRAGEVDVIIAKFALREPDLDVSRTLAFDGRAAVVSTGHPLAGRESVSIEELADCDAFDRPGALPAYVWDQVVPVRTPAGRPIRRRHRVTAIPQMMALVAEAGAVHISLQSLADVAPPGIRIVPIHDLPPAPVTLAWRRDPAPPRHVREFIADAEAAAERASVGA
jgi:DNA-binding transcriptional LysR family regulator